MGMSWTEIGLLALVALVAFGGSNRLPEIARSIGQALGELKQGMREGKEGVVPDSDHDPGPDNLNDNDPDPEQPST